MLASSGSLYDIFSWSGYVVLRFCLMGKERDTKASGAISRWPDEQFIHPHDQRSSLTPPSLLPSLTILHFTQRGLYPLFFFRAITQWRHGAVGAEQHTVWFCASLSLWPIDNFRVLDNSDKTTVSHVFCVCVFVCWGMIRVRERAVSHFVRGLILCCMSVCVIVLCPLQRSPSLLKAAAQSFTPGPKHGCSLCSQNYVAKKV